MKKILSICILIGLLCPSCKQSKDEKSISETVVKETIAQLKTQFPNAEKRIEIGVKQAAALWFANDGKPEDFTAFCQSHFIADSEQLDVLFNKLSQNLELLFGYFNKMNVDLKLPLHLNLGDITEVDEIFGGYDPSAHLTEDLFLNKVAFTILLNFRTYSLEEKNTLGQNWTRKEWAYARIGDLFLSRIPADLLQQFSETTTQADNYIANYNICMGELLNNDGKTLFPKDLKLITHWGLRDELKSQYAQLEGLEAQRMIYSVMKRIIHQDIPQVVINNPAVQWNPIENKVLENGKSIDFQPEPCTRYEQMLKIFNVLQKMDPYQPEYETYIDAKFNGEMEMAKKDVEALFTELVSSPEVKQVAELISKRLGRELEPFDIWYNGFKATGSISEAALDATTTKRYPNTDAVQNDLPNILMKLGWEKTKADYITSKIKVDASRGAGHAWEAAMKGDKARLRTRIGEKGMDYKGYNIAIHEFGHNVEQTLSLYDVDYYMMRSVPNTSFTEALAFILQKRDLELLGQKEENPLSTDLMTLDIFWGSYEIMGVSLVDMNVWEWLYQNPNATKEQLKDAVLTIAKDIWNKYYAPVFGVKDEPILAIYSHMVDYPLYLSAYPIGHLIEFQLENYLAGKNLAKEVERMYTLGLLTPKYWMQQAVGEELSVKPLINAAKIAAEKVK
ncbi:MAG: hypothetical protein LBU91_01170 [Bacteroidales bacterium]|jgi:hypothetical protein|nr:hypothetical protein [Bacteroidales bacterium]